MLGLPSLRAVLGTALLAALAGALAVAFVGTAAVGWDYYLSSAVAKPGHPSHELFRPGGPVGLTTGLLGTALLAALAVHPLRKRHPNARWVGSMTAWMNFHVVAGIAGPAFILLHSGLRWTHGIAGMAFWAMTGVVVTGVFGRYLFVYIPLAVGDSGQRLQERREQLVQLRADLVTHTEAVDDDALNEAIALCRDVDCTVDDFAGLVRLNRELEERGRAVRVLLKGSSLPAEVRREVEGRLIRTLQLQSKVETWHVTQRLSRYWRLLHEPVTNAMYTLAVVHIAITLFVGGSWSALLALLD
jgi:hypothetical protein